MRTRFATLLLLVAAAIPICAIVGAGPAAAKGGKHKIQCDVTGSVTFSPGLSTTPATQVQSVSLQLVNCTNSSVAAITSSKPESSGIVSNVPWDCATLTTRTTTSIPGGAIAWTNSQGTVVGTSSDIYNLTLGSGTITLAGKITAGSFNKGKLSANLTYQVGAGQDCTNTPITSATIVSPSTLTIK